MKKLLSVVAMLLLAAAMFTFAQGNDQPATTTDNNRPTANATHNEDATPRRAEHKDWGWIGLLGLVGLAGLMRRRENVYPATRIDTDRTRDYNSGDLRKVG